MLLWIKWIHVLSAILLFGTGLGSAFYKFLADRSGDLRAIVVTNRHVVLADWLFTTPTVVIQPVTGVLLAHLYGYSLLSPWLLMSYPLYGLAGVCWLPVVYLQIRMRNDAQQALLNNTMLPARYWRDAKTWFWLGVPAFSAMVLIVYLMVFKLMQFPF